MSDTRQRSPQDTRVDCVCGKRIYDGDVITSRCVKLSTGEAKCKCKRWVKVPALCMASIQSAFNAGRRRA